MLCSAERNQEILCVIETWIDMLSMERAGIFKGTYHVLGGVISPLDGVGPDQLFIDGLISRVQNDAIEEIIFALNPNIQGDTTIYYIQKKLQNYNCKITTIARGIAFGGELEYADEMTLAKLKDLAQSISPEKVAEAGTEDRMKLHVAAVLVSNFTNHLYKLAAAYCRKEGIDFRQLQPLIEETALRLREISPAQAQTGPAIRQDEDTIQKHLELLRNEPVIREIYEQLTRSIRAGN